jgi:CRP-like cAMP-binding protein
MQPTRNQAPPSLLEQAHELRLRGQPDAALGLATAFLAAHPVHPGAGWLVSRLLLEAGHGQRLDEAAQRLLAGFIRRGDLPQACLAAQLAQSDELAEALLGELARAFSKGSPRLSVDAPAPPPLPVRMPSMAPDAQSDSGEALVGAAQRALGLFLATDEVSAGSALLPVLPLFSALSASSLHRLLCHLQLRELLPGQYALRQGEPGTETFVVARGVIDIVRTGESGSEIIASLGPGAIFGEMAVVSRAPRAASALAAQPAQLLVISDHALTTLAASDPTIARELGKFCYRRMIGNLIRHSPILAAVEASQRRDLIARFRTERFERGQTLLREGDEAERLYLIASGAVGIRSRDAEGDRVAITELGPGEVVGEISLVMRRPANADVVALHPTVALSLTRDQFQQVIRNHPTLLPKLYDLAEDRAEATRSLLAQRSLDASDVVLL